MYSVNRKRGFTIYEALAAVAVFSIGGIASLSAIQSMARSESRARKTELLQRLAFDKYDELVSTGQATTAQEGTFDDRNLSQYNWKLEVDTTSVDNLDAVTVTVTEGNDSQSSSKGVAEGLFYDTSTISSTGTNSTTGTGG